MFYLLKNIRDLLFILFYLLVFNGFSQENVGNLSLVGKVFLVDLNSSGDTIYSKDTTLLIEVEAQQLFMGKAVDKLKAEYTITDSIYFEFPYNYRYSLSFKCKGFNSKTLLINTLNIQKDASGYVYGYEFPFEIRLVKSKKKKKNESKVVAEIYYNPSTDYFDF